MVQPMPSRHWTDCGQLERNTSLKIILTGATGFVGNEVLTQLLEDLSIEQVIVLVRRSTGVTHPKLKEVIIPDFLDYSKVVNDLKADACIWCLGVSQSAVSQEDYIKITVDYALAAAQAMFSVNPQMRFCFLSGRAADQEEKSKILYGRIKGRAERELSKLHSNVFHFRPALIRPSRLGQKRSLIATIAAPIGWIGDLFTDDFSVDATTLAVCLIGVAKNGADKHIFDNRLIRYYGLSGLLGNVLQ